MFNFVAPVVSLFVGAGLAAATVVGVVSSQTSAPSSSPVDAEAPVIEYGSVTE